MVKSMIGVSVDVRSSRGGRRAVDGKGEAGGGQAAKVAGMWRQETADASSFVVHGRAMKAKSRHPMRALAITLSIAGAAGSTDAAVDCAALVSVKLEGTTITSASVHIGPLVDRRRPRRRSILSRGGRRTTVVRFGNPLRSLAAERGQVDQPDEGRWNRRLCRAAFPTRCSRRTSATDS
jgi:hypothetical protein